MLSTETYKAADDIQSLKQIYFIPQEIVNGVHLNVAHYQMVKVYSIEEEPNLIETYADVPLDLVWKNATFTADSILAFTAKAEPLFRYNFESSISVSNGSFTLQLPSPLFYLPVVNKIQEIEL